MTSFNQIILFNVWDYFNNFTCFYSLVQFITFKLCFLFFIFILAILNILFFILLFYNNFIFLKDDKTKLSNLDIF